MGRKNTTTIDHVFKLLILISVLFAIWEVSPSDEKYVPSLEVEKYYLDDFVNDKIEDRCVFSETKYFVKCIEDVLFESQERRLAVGNLRTQEKMVFWTRLAFWLASLTALFAFGSVYYIRKNLIEARNIGIRQIRSYINISEITIKLKLEEKSRVYAQVSIANTGQSPAYNVSAWYRLSMRHEVIGQSGESNIQRFAVVGGGEKRTFQKTAMSDVPINAKNLRDLNNNAPIFLFGRVDYSDVFGRNCWTEFTFYYNKEMLGSENMMAWNFGNETELTMSEHGERLLKL